MDAMAQARDDSVLRPINRTILVIALEVISNQTFFFSFFFF